jgi:hypothetical protein
MRRRRGNPPPSYGLIRLKGWGFEFQLVPPDISSKALKRKEPKNGEDYIEAIGGAG